MRVVDLRDAAQYAEGHIPGAVHLDPESLRAVIGGLPGQVALAGQVGAALVLLDARTDEEHAAGHIPGAIHMPWQRTREGTTFLADDAILALTASHSTRRRRTGSAR